MRVASGVCTQDEERERVRNSTCLSFRVFFFFSFFFDRFLFFPEGEHAYEGYDRLWRTVSLLFSFSFPRMSVFFFFVYLFLPLLLLFFRCLSFFLSRVAVSLPCFLRVRIAWFTHSEKPRKRLVYVHSVRQIQCTYNTDVHSILSPPLTVTSTSHASPWQRIEIFLPFLSSPPSFLSLFPFLSPSSLSCLCSFSLFFFLSGRVSISLCLRFFSLVLSSWCRSHRDLGDRWELLFFSLSLYFFRSFLVKFAGDLDNRRKGSDNPPPSRRHSHSGTRARRLISMSGHSRPSR